MVIEIVLGIRIAGNDFRYDRKDDDVFCFFFSFGLRTVWKQSRLNMTTPTISRCLDWFRGFKSIKNKYLFWDFVDNVFFVGFY